MHQLATAATDAAAVEILLLVASVARRRIGYGTISPFAFTGLSVGSLRRNLDQWE